MQAGDWSAAIAHWQASLAAWREKAPSPFDGPKFVALMMATHERPWIALSLAHLGKFAQAHHEIDQTPRDCYDCERVRGTIDAMQGNWGGAQYWFARAVKQAPSIPFADVDWGAALMRRGNLDGAIGKFENANKLGPHFADPLEMWGEALIAKNRSDLALAKFADAAKYAPNWGRLHLKWGEALFWLGKKSDAQRQFAIAGHLDLTPEDKSQLARMEALHG